jgi:hypothetical protein
VKNPLSATIVRKPLAAAKKHIPAGRRERIERVVQVTAGTAAAIWMVLRLKRELYGPGGSKMSRYDKAVDKVWRRD